MLTSFVRQHAGRIRLCSYVRPKASEAVIRQWLTDMRKELRRAGYAH